MTANLFGLLLLNACFLAAGLGVTAAVGWWSGRDGLVGSLGVAYLAGVATYGVVAQFLYTLGVSLSRWQVVLVCALPAFGMLAAIDREASRPRRAFPLLALPLCAFLLVLAIDLWYQPLWAYDSWTFWTPKAHALFALDGLDPGWFTSADLISKDYPLLLPAVEAAGFRFTGYETALLDVQSWLFFVAFVRAVYEVGIVRARLSVLWAVLAMLVFAPSVANQLAAAEADIPVAALFAVSGLCAWVWLTEHRASALLTATVLAAGGIGTKVEGLVFVIAMFVALALVAGLERRRRALVALTAGAAAVMLGIAPWRIWMSAHDVHNQAALGRFDHLAHHLEDVPVTVAYLVVELLDPRAWILIVPLGATIALLAVRAGERRGVVFLVGTVVLAFGGLLLAYWSTPIELHAHLATSARRVVTGIVFFVAALTPLLSDDT